MAHTRLTLAASLVLISASTPALACTCWSGTGIKDSVPVADAEGIPPNVIPWVETSRDISVTLQTESGEVVPTTEERQSGHAPCGVDYVMLTPVSPLVPGETYELVTPEHEEGPTGPDLPTTVSFTVSDVEPPAPPTTPDLEGRLARVDEMNTCGGQRFQACIAGADTGLWRVETRLDGELASLETLRLDDLESVELVSEEGEVCVKVQRRDMLGRLSEPFEFCGEAGAETANASFLGFPNCQEIMDGDSSTDNDSGAAGSTNMGDDSGTAGSTNVGDDSDVVTRRDDDFIQDSGCSMGGNSGSFFTSLLVALGLLAFRSQRRRATAHNK